MPLSAQAFFPSIFGNEALSGIAQSSNNNSQSMDLLSPSTSSLSILGQEKTRNSESKGKDSVIVVNNAILPTAKPILGGAIDDHTYYDYAEISIYIVKEGDSLSEIAKMFNVSVGTVRAANNIGPNHKIVVGDKLFILPISGVKHKVTEGQTIKSIASFYKVEINDITFYNNISSDDKLIAGTEIIIPGAEIANEKSSKEQKSSENKNQAGKKHSTSNFPNIPEYFINPTPTGHKTQGLHGPGNRGIDIGARTGTPIYASASGKVSLVSSGWSGGYGNMVMVLHSNGTKTLYAHMSKIATHTGKDVFQGEIIGYVGSTGRSTGPHIHFEVFSAKNPGSDWSWKD
jgi:murein DD-endopeptidase MepM/ murein hydrolase activator NlpD